MRVHTSPGLLTVKGYRNILGTSDHLWAGNLQVIVSTRPRVRTRAHTWSSSHTGGILASMIIVSRPYCLLSPAHWHPSFTFADGRQIEFHNFFNSGCVFFSKTSSEIISLQHNNINTDTLELYVGARSNLYGNSRIFERLWKEIHILQGLLDMEGANSQVGRFTSYGESLCFWKLYVDTATHE